MRRLASECRVILASAAPAAHLCGLLNAGIVALNLWNVVPRLEVLAWLSIALSANAALLAKRGGGERPSQPRSLSDRALRGAILGAVLSACPWGVLGTLYLGSIPHANELILLAVCAGMSASGSVMLAPV